MKKMIDTKPFRGQNFLRAEHFLAGLSHVSNKKATDHLRANNTVWEDYRKEKNIKYLENQPGLDFLMFGRHRKLWAKLFSNGREINASFCACEVMAAYNAELFLNGEEHPSFPEMLYAFEKKYTILSGYFGTSILGVYKYFVDRGYKAEYVSGKKVTKENVDRIEAEYETYVFMSYNNSRNVADMIHTMCITKEKEGFFIHNSFSAPKFYETLFDAVIKYNEYGDNKSAPIIVMGIKK